MIDIRSGELIDMWPDKNSVKMQCISYALKQAMLFLLEKADATRCKCDIDGLSEAALDHLAVELRSMYYDQNLSITQKRKIIKNTLKWYMYAGTVMATNEVAALLFGEYSSASVKEWYDYGGDSGYFRIYVTMTGWDSDAPITYDLDKLEKNLYSAKRRSAHLDGISIAMRHKMQINFAVGLHEIKKLRPAEYAANTGLDNIVAYADEKGNALTDEGGSILY